MPDCPTLHHSNTPLLQCSSSSLLHQLELQQKNEQLEKLLRELKAAQSHLLGSESRFRSVAESANDAIITADGAGRITFWNRRAEAMFGYSEHEALGLPWTMLIPERFRDEYQQGMSRLIETRDSDGHGQVVEKCARRKEGTEFPVELTLTNWESPEGKFVTGIIRDITIRKQQQAALEKAQALLAAENRRKTGELAKARQLQLSGRRLEVCAVGMPPLLLYRAATRQVEALAIKAMPLGSIHEYPYQKSEVALAAGDTLLLMTDGLPELFNPQGEPFDYDRVKAKFSEVAAQSPRQIIRHLVCAGKTWAGGQPQNDDMTFVALQVR